MIQEYLMKRREKIFPEITDWTDPQDKYRLEEDVNKLTQMQWFWFHPTAYVLLYYSPIVSSLLFFGAAGTFFAFKGGWILVGIMGIFCVVMVKELLRRIKFHASIKNTTMYDMFLRDYNIQSVVAEGKEKESTETSAS